MARRATVPDVPDAELPEDSPPDFGDLEALAAADQETRWQVHRIKSQDEMLREPRGKERVWITRIVGPIDLEAFRSTFGGGVFEFWGSVDGTLRTRHRIEIDGPRMTRPIAAAATTHPLPASNPPTAQFVGQLPTVPTDPTQLLIIQQNRLMRRMAKRLEQLEREPRRGSDNIRDLVESVVALNGLIKQPNSDPNMEVVKAYMGVWKEGMEMGQNRDGDSGGADWSAMVTNVAAAITSMTSAARESRIARQRAAAAGGVPPQPRPHSSAEVVEPAATGGSTASPPQPPDQSRWAVAIEVLANALSQGDDPVDTVDTLERVLNTQEFGLLRLGSVDSVIAELERRGALERFPILNQPAAREYLGAVLSEIRSPSGDDSGDGSQSS